MADHPAPTVGAQTATPTTVFATDLTQKQTRHYPLPDNARADAHLIGWLARACRCRIPAIVNLSRTIRRHRDGNLAVVELGMSNSKLEGLTSKIRHVNHRGYGRDASLLRSALGPATWRGVIMRASKLTLGSRVLTGAAIFSLLAGSMASGGGSVASAEALVSPSSTGVPSATAQRAPKIVHAPVPTLHWTKCAEDYLKGLQCAKARVPLDYDHPHGTKTTLALARQRALDRSRRIGTLFVNPGGPGGPARGFVQYAAQHLGRHTRERFDVVGIDPRGIGGSSELVCHDPTPQGAPPPVRRYFPYTSKEISRWLRFDAYFNHLCARHSKPILNHMSTADTARDMDLIRQALGNEKLNYYGISYGSYLGATYAAMFPDNIRAMVVDGVLDPVAWATGRHGNGRKVPMTSRLQSGKGAWLALTSAFAECDRVGKKRCRLAGDAAGKWEQVVHRLKRGPVRIGSVTLRYSDVVGTTLGALYSRAIYRALMRYIAAVHNGLFGPSTVKSASDPARAYKRLRARIDSSDATRPYGFGVGYVASTDGVLCSDSLNPSNPRAWIAAAQHSDHVSPWFGRAWTWANSPCADWPGSSADAFRGPFNVHPSAPVLVVGNLNDPATPISGARRLNGLLGGSRLLILDGWGHGALGEGPCTTKSIQRYLVRGVLPSEGKVCQPRSRLFPSRTDN